MKFNLFQWVILIFSVIGYAGLTSFFVVLLNQFFEAEKNEPIKKGKKAFLKRQSKYPPKKSITSEGYNTKPLAAVKNDVSDYQKIKTSETTLPVIKATVLDYAAGELGENFSEPVRLYYSPEALRDKEFLESVIRSPWNTKTHEKNTNEANVDVNGYPIEAWYDETDKTVYARGFLIGAENIEYAKENKDKPSFGTSAFISFLQIDKESGKTPEGLEYDAVAKKAICNHVAILPNIRDEKNKIVSINAKNALVESSNKKNIGVKNTMEQSEFNALMEKYNEEKNAKNEEIDKIANVVLEKLNSKNGDKPEETKPAANEDKPEETKPAANEDEHKEPDGDEAKAANALPSEKLVSVFSEYYGVRFKKTPTVKQLSEIAEIPYTSFTQALNALRKKSEEILKEIPGEAKNNNQEKVTSINDVLKGF